MNTITLRKIERYARELTKQGQGEATLVGEFILDLLFDNPDTEETKHLIIAALEEVEGWAKNAQSAIAKIQ